MRFDCRNILITLFFTANYFIPIVAQEIKPIQIGESITQHSETLQELRTVNIYLPKNYKEEDTLTYNTIYLLDGGIDEDFLHVSGLVQFLSFQWIGTIKPSIVVGVANVDRKRDFTFPTSIEIDQRDFPTSGHSGTFITYLNSELIPMIEKRYKTTKKRTLIGQSLGGLLATEILLSMTDLFNQYIIVSPSLWWDNQSLMERKIFMEKRAEKVFVAVGKEGEIMENDAKQLFELLNPHFNVAFQFLENCDHGDVLHLAVYNAFRSFKGIANE